MSLNICNEPIYQSKSSAKSLSFDDNEKLTLRKLPEDNVECLDPIWLYDDDKGKPHLRCIEDQPWFHGFREKFEIQLLLRNEGDWLVQITGLSQPYNFAITIRVTKKVITKFPLASSDEKFWFLSAAKRNKRLRYFLNPVDLVEYYKIKSLPGCYMMKNCVYRPCWSIKSSKITYDNENDLLNQGTFSSLYNGRYRLSNKKCINVVVKKYKNCEENIHQFIEEAKSMSYLIHSNLVLFYGIIENDPKIRILESCIGGSLSKHLKKQQNNISISELFLYCYEICRGMEYLHYKNRVHKNLKSANILISQTGCLKIGDFEFNCLPYINFTKISAFMAPELFQDVLSYSFKSDVWAMSVVMYEIFSNGQIPFEGEKEETIINKIKNGNLWSMPLKLPDNLVTLVKMMLKATPTERPTFKFLKNYFLENVSKSKKVFSSDMMTLNELSGVKRTKFYLKHSYSDNNKDNKTILSCEDFLK